MSLLVRIRVSRKAPPMGQELQILQNNEVAAVEGPIDGVVENRHQADPKMFDDGVENKFKELGNHCKKLESTQREMASIVAYLAHKGIKLLDCTSFNFAKKWIRDGHPELDYRTLHKYTCHLRSWLSCPPEKLPSTISISAPVPLHYNPGDEVDVMDSSFNWWHAVVVSVTARILTVYWVGCSPLRVQRSAHGTNPQRVSRSKNQIRVHSETETFCTGDDPMYTVDWIAQNELKKTHPLSFKDIVHVSSSDQDSGANGDDTDEADEDIEESNEKEEGGKDKSEGGTGAAGSRPRRNPKRSLAEQAPDPPAPRSSDRQPRPKPKSKPDRESATPAPPVKQRSSSVNSSDDEKEGDEQAESELTGGAMNRRRKRPFKQSSVCVFDWLAPFMSSSMIMYDLSRLESSPSLQCNDNFFRHYLGVLERLRFGQGCMYNAAEEFREYFVRQSEALRSYTIIQDVEFDKTKHDRYISDIDRNLEAAYTEAFTRNELVTISCSLAYPGLSFTNIMQKTGTVKSSGAVRGMAYVPEQLESFFHRRLVKLRLIDRRYHPEYMQALSTVVLSSSYCQKQLGTWDFGEDWKSRKASVFKLEHFPTTFSINGVYAQVDHKFGNVSTEATGEIDWSKTMVYAQVMSLKTSNALGIPSEFNAPFSKAYALVLLYQPEKSTGYDAHIVHWISIGEGQAASPICLAKFRLMKSRRNGADKENCSVRTDAQIFSHLDAHGIAVHRVIEGPRPTATESAFMSNAGVELEYGPELKFVRSSLDWKPAGLLAQLQHCDGNFYHAVQQWQPDESVNGRYRLSTHKPLLADSHMENPTLIEPLYLKGPAHQNSLSMVIGINYNTTLTFPNPSRRLNDVVQPTPFGGLKIVSFIQEHMGSAYGVEANERPHVYAHCSDLRQFPAATAGNLLLILACKQRIQSIRQRQQARKG